MRRPDGKQVIFLRRKHRQNQGRRRKGATAGDMARVAVQRGLLASDFHYTGQDAPGTDASTDAAENAMLQERQPDDK